MRFSPLRVTTLSTILLAGTAAIVGTAFAKGPGPNPHHGSLWQRIEQEIAALRMRIEDLEAKASPKAQIIFRDFEHQATVQPGDRLIATNSCAQDEVVVSGGYLLIPDDRFPVTTNAFFFDGVVSGWRVDLLNDRSEPAILYVRLNLACAKGTGVPGQQ